MNKFLPAAAAFALVIGMPLVAEAQNQGRGQGGEQAQDRGGGRGAENKPDRAANRGQSAANPPGRGQERAARDSRPNSPDVRETPRGAEIRSKGRNADERDDRPGARSGPAIAAASDRAPAIFRVEPNRGLIVGCPPGLAKRDNGCLPPGQERKIERARHDYLWGGDRDAAWRYDDGYLYQMDRSGSILGWLPALGGALAPGATWPQQYAYQPAPQYYTDYFRLNAPYDYRYANGALYGVDPKTQAITQVVALLTGQPISVGQPMPAGYDVYNVPYAYRDRYADSATSQYRYNDGYVYQVDPTTRLVQAAIQLLT